jgi:DNA polymerase-1
MQQIPADNSFRNCFTAPEGWSYVSADYSSQELNVIAFGSKDPVWIEALNKGEDLHSVCADLVYGSKWADQAEPGCEYMKNKSKCNCKEHKKLRTHVKTINFGLAYGMGANKLSDTLGISSDDAKKLINTYFESFPAIKGFLDRLGTFGTTFGYIKTFPPYNRKRWFSNWYPRIWDNKSSMMELGSIERASKNTPIQGASADMTKKALILMREYIQTVGVPVKLVMTVHDQIDTICANDYVKTWTYTMKKIMEDAALEIVTNGLLKAEVTVSKCWEK